MQSVFKIRYVFRPGSFQLSAHAAAAGVRLIFPVVASRSEVVKYRANNSLIIQKAAAHLTLTSAATMVWRSINPVRAFNFVPGFEAVVVENSTDGKGNCFIRLEVDKQIPVTSGNKK